MAQASATTTKQSPGGKNTAALLGGAGAVFVLAYLAYLTGAADGTVDIGALFGWDTPLSYFWYDILRTGKYDFWQSVNGNSNYFADLAILSVLYSAFGYVAGLYVWGFAVAALSAAGWIVLCAAVFGNNPHRAALVILLHALPFLFLSWRGNDIFFTHILPIHHFLTWVSIPWSLWLVLRIMQKACRRSIVALVLLTAVSVLSDPITMPWFVAPLFAVLLIEFAFAKKQNNKPRIRKIGLTAAAAGGGVAAGLLASQLVPFATRAYSDRVYGLPSPSLVADTVANVAEYAYLVAAHNPLCAMVWLVFVIVAGRGLFLAVSSKRREFSARRFLFLFVPLAMMASLAAVVVTGLFPYMNDDSFAAAGGFSDKRYIHFLPPPRSLGPISRYLIPLLFFPLFIGWIIYLPQLRPRIVAMAAVVIAIAAAPRIAQGQWQKLNPYAHPFYDCIHKAAERLNARSYISAQLGGSELFVYPKWRWESFFTVSAVRQQGGSYLFSNGIYNTQMKPGPADFVIANSGGGKFSVMTPGREPHICEGGDYRPCVSAFHLPIILDDPVIVNAFGEANEVIHCPGNATIYHYDPPIPVESAAYKEIIGNLPGQPQKDDSK